MVGKIVVTFFGPPAYEKNFMDTDTCTWDMWVGDAGDLNILQCPVEGGPMPVIVAENHYAPGVWRSAVRCE